MTDAPRPRSVSLEQAAARLAVSRRTVYNRIRDGRLRTVRTLGVSQRVLVESLEDELLVQRGRRLLPSPEKGTDGQEDDD